MKKHKKLFLGVGGFIVFIIVLNLLIGIFSPTQKNEKKGEDPVVSPKIVNELTCTMTDDDDFEYTIILSFDSSVLIRKMDEMKWEEKEKEVCDFYKKREEVYNSIAGIRDTVTCSDTSGVRTTLYQMDSLDKVEAKIGELKYIREDGTFDIKGYIAYRQKEGYRCVES